MNGLGSNSAFSRAIQRCRVSSGAGYFAWLYALKHEAPTRVTVFLALNPPTAAFLAWAPTVAAQAAARPAAPATSQAPAPIDTDLYRLGPGDTVRHGGVERPDLLDGHRGLLVRSWARRRKDE